VDFSEQLDLFFGEASPATCRVYARLARNADVPADLELAGTLRGPRCEYAQTLSAATPLVDLGRGSTPLAQAILPDPCFWSPELPYLYDARVELRRCGEVLDVVERPFGIRPLGAAGAQFRLCGKPWVLRGAMPAEAPPTDLTPWHTTETALMIEHPGDALCAEASRLGVLMMAVVRRQHAELAELAHELRRLARWPAVGMAVLADAAAAQSIDKSWLRGIAPNLVIGRMIDPAQPAQLQGWEQFVVAPLRHEEPLDRLAQLVTRWRVPIVALQSGESHTGVVEARASCDRLQARLSAIGQLAGYAVAPGRTLK
jgi:hypothetical protein